jgi:hypothetical protein
LLATLGSDKIQSDSIKIRSYTSPWLIARSRLHYSEKGLLRKILRSHAIVKAAPEEAIKRFTVALEKLFESVL